MMAYGPGDGAGEVPEVACGACGADAGGCRRGQRVQQAAGRGKSTRAGRPFARARRSPRLAHSAAVPGAVRPGRVRLVAGAQAMFARGRTVTDQRHTAPPQLTAHSLSHTSWRTQAWRAWTSPGGRDAHHPQLLGSLRTPRSSANGGPAHQPLASKPGLGGLDTPPRGARGAGLGHPLLSGSSLIGTDVAGGPLLGSSAPGTPTRGGAAAKSLAGHHLESSTSGGAPPPPPLPWGAEGAGAELRGPLLSEHDVTPRAAAAQPSGEQPGDGAGGQGGAETPPPPECQDGEEGAEAAPDGEEAPMESPAGVRAARRRRGDLATAPSPHTPRGPTAGPAVALPCVPQT